MLSWNAFLIHLATLFLILFFLCIRSSSSLRPNEWSAKFSPFFHAAPGSSKRGSMQQETTKERRRKEAFVRQCCQINQWKWFACPCPCKLLFLSPLRTDCIALKHNSFEHPILHCIRQLHLKSESEWSVVKSELKRGTWLDKQSTICQLCRSSRFRILPAGNGSKLRI